MATSDEDELMEDVESDQDFFDDSDDEENFVARPAKKTAKKATKVASAVLESSSPNVVAATKVVGKKKTVEEIYQKKSQLEHILLRPDTYVGSTERVSQPMFVLQGDKIVEREITFTPGLYKIFDEIVVNAADNKQRDPEMSKLDITVDAAANKISVLNNGTGIPVTMHKEHKVYVPTMIFGQLLTGSNFDDNEQKTTGGRNGYGAKLANVFSTEFIIECASTETGMKFHQVFRNNMSVAEEPTIKPLTAAEKKNGDFVKITFSPDLPRFGMTHLDDDAVALFSKRAYDIAGSMANSTGKKLVVTLNGNKLPIKNFKEYLGLFQGIDPPVAYEKNERWEVGVSASPDQVPRNVSFVNAISTSKGGMHVTYIADQIASHLVKICKKRNKGGAEIKPMQIKNNLTIFVNCLIVNPTFDSQTKEFMTTKSKSFGSTFQVSEKFLKQVEKSDIVEAIISQAQRKTEAALKRKGGVKKTKLTGIPKLDDANFAGGAKSYDCTLIVTEGDSAKSLAMSGLSVVGRDYYGVFPLRGKLLNVRDATTRAVSENAEIKNLVDIMGLKYHTVYTESNIKTLRYGHLMIMADQDSDGSHIKGLVINFIHKFWPSLLEVPGFLRQFITPIVKVTKGKKSQAFYTLPEYEQWRESTGNNGKGFTAKYYKGLGTSTSAEAKEYFSNLDQNQIPFTQLSLDTQRTEMEEDDMDQVLPDFAASGTDLIDMVFRKTRVEDRKIWLQSLTEGTYMDYKEAAAAGGVKFSDFINKEYILFSNYDNVRSIPCLFDGFKPSQRKVLFGCFKRNLKSEVKVAQLTGYIAEHTGYHHGEASLQETIVKLAQSFTGSNNVNLLTPSGQFGTRLMGGKDAASPRYIFTKLEPITRAIYHPDDDEILTYLTDDGLSIEPKFYMPVIPMILVNGAEGIGTGWSTSVPNYNTREVIANLRRIIAGVEPHDMVPFYSGFLGEIVPKSASGGFEVRGRIDRIDDTTLSITELPIKKWTQDYKQFIEGMLTGDGKTAPVIKDFKEDHTDTTVSFTIMADKEMIDTMEKEKNGLYGKFKLTGSISAGNMTLFDAHGKLVKYSGPIEIMKEFYALRLEFYVHRKALLVKKLEAEQRMLSNKARFVEEVCSGRLVVNNRKRTELLAELQERGYNTIAKEAKTKKAGDDDSHDDEEDADEEASDAELAKGYEYLLGMKIWSLTFEKAEALRALLQEKTNELEILKATTPEQVWLKDLDAVEAALDVRDSEISNAAANEKKAQQKNQKRGAKAIKKKAVAAKKKTTTKKDQWDSDTSDDDDPMDSLSSDDDDDFYAANKKPVAKKAVAKAPAPVVKPALQKSQTQVSKKAATKTQVSKEALDDEDPMDSLSFDEDDDFLATSEKPATKKEVKKAPTKVVKPALQKTKTKAGKKASPKTSAVSVTEAIAAAAKTQASKEASAIAAAPKTMESDSDSDVELSLSQRVSMQLAVSPPTKLAAKRISRELKKRPSPRMYDSEADVENSIADPLEEMESTTFAPASLSPTTKKAPTVKNASKPLKRVTNTAGVVSKSKGTRGKATTKPKAVKKKATYNSDSEDESSVHSEDSEHKEAPVKQPAPLRATFRARRTRAPPVTYAVDSDDDESIFSA